MAEINERASVSSPPLPPSPTPAPEVRQLAEVAHEKMAALLAAQLDASTEEYRLLQNMNDVSAQRYKDMKSVASSVSSKLSKLDEKYEALRPYLRQVDELDEGTQRLEEATDRLEAYVTSLEQKVQSLREVRENRT